MDSLLLVNPIDIVELATSKQQKYRSEFAAPLQQFGHAKVLSPYESILLKRKLKTMMVEQLIALKRKS